LLYTDGRLYTDYTKRSSPHLPLHREYDFPREAISTPPSLCYGRTTFHAKQSLQLHLSSCLGESRSPLSREGDGVDLALRGKLSSSWQGADLASCENSNVLRQGGYGVDLASRGKSNAPQTGEEMG